MTWTVIAVFHYAWNRDWNRHALFHYGRPSPIFRVRWNSRVRSTIRSEKNSDWNRQESVVEGTRLFRPIPCSARLKSRQSTRHSGSTCADFSHDFEHSGAPFKGEGIVCCLWSALLKVITFAVLAFILFISSFTTLVANCGRRQRFHRFWQRWFYCVTNVCLTIDRAEAYLRTKWYQDITWHTTWEVGLGPGDIVLDGDPVPPKRDTAPNFRLMSIVAKRCRLAAIVLH